MKQPLSIFRISPQKQLRNDLLCYAPCGEGGICQVEHGWLSLVADLSGKNPNGQIKNDSVRDYFMW